MPAAAAPPVVVQVGGTGGRTASAGRRAELARQVLIRRTSYGIPHILGENLAAAAFGLGYCQVQDYGMEVVRRLVEGRGESARRFDSGGLEGDFSARQAHRRAVDTYPLLDADTRAVLEGFAAGVNHYIALHAAELPDWVRPDFTAFDVAARDIGGASSGVVRAFLRRMGAEPRSGSRGEAEGDRGNADRADGDACCDEGSNAWAFAPSRTVSGKAILLRNPHLAWTAGYYEAQLTVPGVLNFYGDFRIGGPFGIIGGFNEHLGWATTNNDPVLDVFYALEADAARPDHYLLDGASRPLRREEVTVEGKDGNGGVRETREFWFSEIGPVIHRVGSMIYVVKSAGFGEYRRGQQFLRMMRARSLAEWRDAMSMRAVASSNFTYADREGNIYYVWNAAIPALPHAPPGGAAVPARGASDVWTDLVPFEALPQLLNPGGGYVQNANDPPYFTNLNEILDRSRFPANFPEPRLGLRTQHSLDLVHNERKLSLEDVLALKHSMRMLVAERVKADLMVAVLETGPEAEVRAAIELVGGWDNRVSPESRGAVLFEAWFHRYTATTDTSAWFGVPWSADRPTETPYGLGERRRAAEAFRWAVGETNRRHGRWDVSWGEVHRVRRGEVDVPVGGCSGTLGCFRVLNFEEDRDGKRRASGGDGWVLAVEFGDRPRAYSVLAYGQSPRPGSPHHDDQAELFAKNGAKRVAFTEEEIARRLVRAYHPGGEAATTRRGR